MIVLQIITLTKVSTVQCDYLQIIIIDTWPKHNIYSKCQTLKLQITFKLKLHVFHKKHFNVFQWFNLSCYALIT